jgi:16S rRNA (cytosine1402-N4)-methyltransferase
MNVVHLPVMAREVIGLLKPERGGVYVDATVGPGGHSEAILGRLAEGDVLIGIDRDEEAVRAAGERIRDGRFVLKKGRFSDIARITRDLGFGKVDGVLFDLGISMLQLKGPERGFSFGSDGPLDMRMDRGGGATAADIVNSCSQKELERILREYGEERYARKIARAIVEGRRRGRINTCRELSELVGAAVGRRGRIHPATRTFQALRIEVNEELDELKKGLQSALSALAAGGRMVVVSYHSLEDRAVKVFIREKASEGAVRALTKKPLRPESEEVMRNPSARSARLRAAEAL